MKSLQLRGRRQIAEPPKYCLVLVIVFFDVCFFSICFVSHRLEFWFKIPYTQDLLSRLNYEIDLAESVGPKPFTCETLSKKNAEAQESN